MNDAQWADLAKLLGVALPLVAFLWRILEREHDERIRLQDQHNAAMAKQSDSHTEMVKSQTTAAIETAIGLKDLAASVREFIAQDRAEHKELLEAVHHEGRLRELEHP
jgi:hypothetical protein